MSDRSDIDAGDPVDVTRRLIRCPSVTPEDAGALGVLEEVLGGLGFACQRLPFEAAGTPAVDNLWARLGEREPVFCFAGHTDVVPVGDPSHWRFAPFSGKTADDAVWGRGAVDMKGAIAAFVAAIAHHLSRHGPPRGSIALLITGDEEGPAVNGTVRVLDWLARNGERIDACLVGEPTNPAAVGDMGKIGRRGSLNARLVVDGRQGHVAYPADADNPVHPLITMLADLVATPLDAGNDHFQPSSLQVTSVDVGNATTNLIPAAAEARFNVRFNDEWTGAALEEWLRRRLDAHCRPYSLEARVSGESFLTAPGPLTELLERAVEEVTGRRPVLSTSGGTSDARFIKDHAPVVEFGLISRLAHQVDERVPVSDLVMLRDIYAMMLDGYFVSKAP